MHRHPYPFHAPTQQPAPWTHPGRGHKRPTRIGFFARIFGVFA